MTNNPLLEVRKSRQDIANECGNDPNRVFEFYRKHQEGTKANSQLRFIHQKSEIHQSASIAEE